MGSPTQRLTGKSRSCDRLFLLFDLTTGVIPYCIVPLTDRVNNIRFTRCCCFPLCEQSSKYHNHVMVSGMVVSSQVSVVCLNERSALSSGAHKSTNSYVFSLVSRSEHPWPYPKAFHGRWRRFRQHLDSALVWNCPAFDQKISPPYTNAFLDTVQDRSCGE